MEGPPKAVVTHYHRLIFAPAEQRTRIREEIRGRVAEEKTGGEKKGTQLVIAEKSSDPFSADGPEPAFLDEALVSKSMVQWPSRGAADHRSPRRDGRRRPRERARAQSRVRLHL